MYTWPIEYNKWNTEHTPIEWEFVAKPIKYTNYFTYVKKSDFESKLYEDTEAEIARLEKELNFLRQFLVLIGSSPKSPAQSISKPARKSSAARSAPRSRIEVKPEFADRKLKSQEAKSKYTKSGKKIGRPTNAEYLAKENASVVDDAIKKAIPKIKKFEKELNLETDDGLGI